MTGVQTCALPISLVARGAKGVVDAWRTSILTALDDDQSKHSPLDHKLIKFLLAEFVEALAELDARKGELDGQIKAAVPDKGDDGDDDGDNDPAVDEAQIKEWKRQLSVLKKDIKAKTQGFALRLNAAVDGLDDAGAAALLLTVLSHDMRAILERYIGAQRQQMVTAVENWWEKYSLTLTHLMHERDQAAMALDRFLKGLGYV